MKYDDENQFENKNFNNFDNDSMEFVSGKIPNQKNKKKNASNKSGLIILISIIVIACAFVTYSFFENKNSSNLTTTKIENSKPRFNSDFSSNGKNINFSFFNSSNKNENVLPQNNYIAKLYITGTIQAENKTYNQKWLLETVKKLKDDKNNKGLILFIDSPGGSVYESDEMYLALSEYQKARKPVWTYMGSLAASGGYYIACGAEYICANRNTLTGSIGVIAGQSVDLTEMFEKMGIKSKTFTAGKNKNMLNFNSPLTEEQAQIMQSIADDAYDQFTSIVAINRRLPIEKVKTLADGRIYTARQALDNKLIDKICSFDEAVSALKAKYQITNAEVVDFKYTQKLSWMEYLSSEFSKISPLAQSAESKALEMIAPKIKYPAYYCSQVGYQN